MARLTFSRRQFLIQYPTIFRRVVSNSAAFPLGPVSSDNLKMTETQKPSVLKISGSNVCSAATIAASDLKLGNIVAVPTDTIYGVACLVQIPEAVDKLYALKGRHPEKPISICLPEVADLRLWANVSTVSEDLLNALLPGPVTLCFDRTPDLNPEFNPEARLVGVRIPDHHFVREMCRKVGGGSPVALTSANVSQAQSSLEVGEFIGALGHGISTVFDGGRLGEDTSSHWRQGSTIVDLSVRGGYKVVRNGSALHQTVTILKQHGLTEL